MALLPVKRRDREVEATGLARLHRDMDDLLHGFFGDWSVPGWGTRRWPVLDVRESSDTYVVTAEVPGCEAGDIDISVQGNTLIISGEKKEEQTQKSESYYHSERTFGSFRRELSLGCDVKAEKIDASYDSGVLTVRVPKSEKAKPVKIKVKDVGGRGASKK